MPNEVRDVIGNQFALVWIRTITEPVVREANLQDNTLALRADLAVHKVWDPQTEALFDISVVDTDIQAYENCTPIEVLETAEREKKMKNSLACEERRGVFTPLCCSVDGMLWREADVFLRSFGWKMGEKI